MSLKSNTEATLQLLMSGQGNYENAETAERIVDLMSGYFSDDGLMSILDHTKRALADWRDNYDQTPY